MSSWNKAAKSNQKVHRERAQPASRNHLGILEKKKDYKLRANDQHKKDATLKLLRKRAMNKNPDEFYHHMINSKTKDGEHHELDLDHSFSKDQIKLMKTQDIKYIGMKRTMEANKIQRLQSRLHMTDVVNETPNKHIFFLEEDQEPDEFDLAKRLDTHPDLIGRRTNRPHLEDLQKLKMDVVSPEEITRINHERERSYAELKKRIAREKELTIAQKTLEIKRVLKEKRALKPKRVKKGTANRAPVFKFKFERKR
ncbi:probable U3 small nucleolar RNA-associated protein 11 [Anopheles ziemanni]|uniref:probable U3 small nucleolar RNA-associated protein 11 n=1 Tax=Anopheles coustani TaxID=139045 RepID=UPI00265A11B0|nr:probable U3 small nucleolar RNA-associated protein 11 [Anopheles coustani]XP_058174797.1 probable U3 small nucleolar RNA-associated protein 11 [Anopheles ziemanni]